MTLLLFSQSYTGEMSGTSRFPIGEWARQRKEKRQVLIEVYSRVGGKNHRAEEKGTYCKLCCENVLN